MSIQAIREFIQRHSAAHTGLTALVAALEVKASGTPLDPKLDARIHELLAALGAADMLTDVSAQEVAPLVAELRAMSALDRTLLRVEARASSWSYTDPEILQRVGETSAGFVQPLARAVVPTLEGLGERLAKPGGRFLDVGTGVAGLAIAVARTWPELRVVGIDPWRPSLELARRNVESAGLSERIELREQGAESLADEQAFDLAWLPAIFLPEGAVRPSAERVLRALRPGGFLLFNAFNPKIDGVGGALWRLRLAMFGDSAMPTDAAESLLREVGYTEVRTLPSPPGTILCLVAGRRASG